jgi:ATP/ADP translocase
MKESSSRIVSGDGVKPGSVEDKSFFSKLKDFFSNVFCSYDRIVTFALAMILLALYGTGKLDKWVKGYFSVFNLAAAEYVKKVNLADLVYRLIVYTSFWGLIASTIRQHSLPLKEEEWYKAVPFIVSYFCIITVYSMFRITKDTFVIGTVGGELSSLCKIIVLVATIALTYIFIEIRSKVCFRTYSIVLIVPYILFYGLFVLWLFNNPRVLPSVNTVRRLLDNKYIPTLFVKFIACWPYVLYYVLTETLMTFVGTFFWEQANKCIDKKENKRYFAVIIFFSQIATLYAGDTVNCFSKSSQLSTEMGKIVKSGDFADIFSNLGNIVGIHADLVRYSTYIGLIALVVFILMSFYVYASNPEANLDGNVVKSTDKNEKTDNIDSILEKEPAAKHIMYLSICCGLFMAFTEQFSKNQLKSLVNNYATFSSSAMVFQANFGLLLGVVAAPLIRNVSFYWRGISTPIVSLITTSFVFGSALVFKFFPGQNADFVSNIAKLGFYSLTIFKTWKYVVFDITKENSITTILSKECASLFKRKEGAQLRTFKSWGAVAIVLALFPLKNMGSLGMLFLMAGSSYGAILTMMRSTLIINKRVEEIEGGKDSNKEGSRDSNKDGIKA